MPRRSRLRYALLALALLAGAGTAAPSARAAEPGVVADLTWHVPDADKAKTSRLLSELGSRWVRLHVQWREAEPIPGLLNEWWMDEYEKALAHAEAAGQRVIFMISEAPEWASGSSQSNVPADPQLYANFLARFAARFRGRVAAYEIWNEPNIRRFWSPGPDPAAYVALLRASYSAVRTADPNALVVFGGLSTNDYRFLEAAYEAGAKGYFDVLATHPYPYCGSSAPGQVRYSEGRISRDSFLGYREMRASMLARGDDKPIWFTEFGWSTTVARCDPGAGMWQGGVSERAQAQYLARAFELVERDPYVEVAIWYALRNNVFSRPKDDPEDPEANYGLVRSDFSPKPAFWAYRSYALRLPSLRAATRTTLRLRSGRSKPRAPLAFGCVRHADEGRVRIVVQRRARGGRWKTRRRVEALVRRDGCYRKRLALGMGTYRILARYLGTERFLPSVSPKRRWRP